MTSPQSGSKALSLSPLASLPRNNIVDLPDDCSGFVAAAVAFLLGFVEPPTPEDLAQRAQRLADRGVELESGHLAAVELPPGQESLGRNQFLQQASPPLRIPRINL